MNILSMAGLEGARARRLFCAGRPEPVVLENFARVFTTALANPLPQPPPAMHLSTRLLLRARTFSTCHASVCTSLSSPLSYDTSWPLASPSPDEVTIAVAGTGVNFAEILQTRGLYQEKKEPPFVPGNECAGEVTQVGANVTNLKIGDQVICLARGNGYASHVTSSSASCIKLPDSARSKDLTEAAALMVNYGTAHLALTSRANLQPNEHVLVTAAAGGVGLAACELATLMGAGSVIAACGSDDKITLARTKGAQELGVNYRDLDQVRRRGGLRRCTGGDGVKYVAQNGPRTNAQVFHSFPLA